MKTGLYNVDPPPPPPPPPLKPHFYIVKLGFTGVYIISAQNIDRGYPLEPPSGGGSNEYPQFMFEQKCENYQNFYLKIFIFRW